VSNPSTFVIITANIAGIANGGLFSAFMFSLRRTKLRLEDNIEMYLKKIACEGLD